MFTELELEYLLEDYKVIMDEKMHKHKIISVLLLSILISVVIIIFALGFFDNETVAILTMVYGSILIIVCLIYILFSYGAGSKKPFYDVIVDKVVSKINSTMELNLEYSSERKIDFKHNINSGIFSKYCRASARMHIKGLTNENNSFEIYELTLITGGGKNQTTHLNGIYIVTNNASSVLQQVRTNGKPHLKETKYQRIESDFEYKIYLDEDLDASHYSKGYNTMFSRVMSNVESNRGYLSVIEGETHFALHPFKLYKYRKLTLENLNSVYNEIKSLIELVDKLSIEEF